MIMRSGSERYWEERREREETERLGGISVGRVGQWSSHTPCKVESGQGAAGVRWRDKHYVSFVASGRITRVSG